MKRTVGIIGAGHVGADTAFSLVTQGLCDQIVLIDHNEAKARSQGLELRDMASLVASRVHIVVNDYAALQQAQVVVMAVGPTTLLREDRMEELLETSATVRRVVPQIMAGGFDGVIINITNPCDVITAVIQRESGLPASRVFGTGTSLDTARMKRVVGEFFGVDPKSVSGYVMGEHGESQFVAWSTVRIGGCLVSAWESDKRPDLAAMKNQVRAGGWEILLGKGWTSFGIGTATARLVDAVLSDARTVFPVSAWDRREAVYIGQPAIVGAEGIVRVLPVTLAPEERLAYAASAGVIGRALSSL
ncbi:L-lactate dehydrogenase [Acerihabitans arboris]|uniref:L-lactate dehydrogenase n=1 Tax=Acerihabitans arboris TaxID=2691583 RepID=A0A845SM56_9GAMM|nr:L-lactate dehydrogenase [Acerihabitans arboris]NDL62345.1 L-lactate dehydrogenase [Acerihabitans arboris]